MKNFLTDKRFIFGLAVFFFIILFFSFAFKFYKPLIVFSDSVDIRFGIVDLNTDTSDMKIYQYISFTYDYKADKNRIKLDVIQGKSLIKKIMCLEGQVLKVDVEKRDFYCDGVFIGHAREKFLNGDKAPIFVYDGVIPEGHFFVEGDNKYSFDSRYWGFVESSEISGRVIPLF